MNLFSLDLCDYLINSNNDPFLALAASCIAIIDRVTWKCKYKALITVQISVLRWTSRSPAYDAWPQSKQIITWPFFRIDSISRIEASADFASKETILGIKTFNYFFSSTGFWLKISVIWIFLYMNYLVKNLCVLAKIFLLKEV